MLPEEKLRVALFCAVVVVVYLAAIGFGIHALVRTLARRRSGIARDLGRRTWWFRAMVLGLAALGIGCFAYARLIEPYWLDVTHVRIELAKLPAGARPIRIVQISDVHSDPEVRLEETLPISIAAEHPDFIVFTGDAINSPEGLDNFRRLMTRLAAIAPTYAVRGNWDVWNWSKLDLFGGTQVTELDATAVRVPLTGAEVWVAGAAVGDAGKLPATLAMIPATAISVVLYHYPDEIEHVSPLGVDLYLAGHTHGGQVRLPLYGALVTFSKFGKRYEAGLYHEDKTALYVNRGIGMEGGSAPRIRFLARPEVTVLELVPVVGSPPPL